MNLFENLQKMHKVQEDTELRPISGPDIWAWQGANNFADGSAPLIAETEYATMIVSGSDEKDGSSVVAIYYGNDDDKWAFKEFATKEDGIKGAKMWMDLIEEPVDEEELKTAGFTLV